MRLSLFCKYPRAGAVKTRMQPDLPPDLCEDLAWHLIHWSIDLATRTWPGDVVLAVWPPDAVTRMERNVELPVVAQQQGGLGDKMAKQLRPTSGDGSNAVMGCDTPHLEADTLKQAWRALSAGRDVIGPADDGGFYFFGTADFKPSMFQGIKWGGNEVLNDFMANIVAIRPDQPLLLTTATDLDTFTDVCRVAQNFSPLAAWLESNGLTGYPV